MTVPNRNYQSPAYRYGFQGQEKDDKIKGYGNSINYKFRMHDPRVGRFFAVDPLTPKYPHYTPYSFSGNMVISHRELEGLEQIGQDIYLKYKDKPVTRVYGSKGLKLDRLWGALQVIGGAVEVVGGIAGIVAPEPATSVGGALLATNGLDNVQAGARTVWTGESTDTVLHQAVETGSEALGATPEMADKIATGTEVITGFGGALKGTKLLSKIGKFKPLKIVTDINIDKISKYLKTLDADAANDVMIGRLNKISKNELDATDIDLNFYNHELREMNLKKNGMSHDAAHEQTLMEQGIKYEKGYEKKLYTKEALDAGDAQFRKE